MEIVKKSLSWSRPYLKYLISLLLTVLICFLLPFLIFPLEDSRVDFTSSSLSESDRGITTVSNQVVYLENLQSSNANLNFSIDTSYFIKRQYNYHKELSEMRDRFDFSDEDYYRVDVYQLSDAQKPYKTFNLLELIQEEYPGAYITDTVLKENTDGHSYIGVSYSNLDDDKLDHSYRLLSIETGEWVTKISGKESGFVGFSDTNSDKVLAPYRLSVSGEVDAIQVHFSDIRESKLQELNIGEDWTLISLMKEKKSGTLYFFGDDALEQVSYLLAKKGKTDMFDGLVLNADDSKDGKERQLSSYEDFKNYSR